MGKRRMHRAAAWLLTGALAVTALPQAAVFAAEEDGGDAGTPLLAEFDFAKEASDGIFSGGNAQAETVGSCALKKSYGTDYALYLNGSDAYLNVTASDGTPLLSGKEEITVSYDAKYEGGTGWAFFAAPNASDQSYTKEHYLGALHSSGSVTVERYDNSGARPGNNLGASYEDGWVHVDILAEEGHTSLYVNGEKQDESDSDYKLSSILGGSSVVQVGRGNWEGGEYYKGYIDNIRIYDGVITAEELAAEKQEFEAYLEEVNAPASPQELLQEAYDELVIPSMDDVRNDLALVKEGKNGAAIEWTSDAPDVITDTPESEEDIYDGGIVTRPAAGESAKKVTLTAVLSLEGAEAMTKTFDVTVTPKTADLDTDYSAGYLWTNFGLEDEYEKIFFGYSEDGLNWGNLNKVDGVAKAILTNDAEGSDLGVRDPHLIRSADGDKYWILGTDLHAEGDGSGGSGWDQLSASQNLVVWESTDLVNWSEPDIVYAGFDQAGCVWAPEAIYDETAGDYVVYWSARDKSKADTEENALRVYVCRTRDFHTFSEPAVWLSEDQDSGKEVNIIDTTIVKDNGKYYRFSTSDWNTVIDVSETLDIEDVLDVRVNETKSQPNGSWERIVTRSGAAAAGFDSREGFTVYRLPDGRWCAMGDHSGYQAFVTSDLSSGTFTAETANFETKFRHGTVVRLSAAEEARILEAFQERESEDISAAEPVAQEPVLEYNFENDLGKMVMTDTAEGNASADDGTIYGTAAVVYNEETGSNVLKLDGAAGSYAELPQGFFDKRNKMTISMDVKSELSSGNFFTFTYGLDSNVYNFLRVRGTDVTSRITTSSYGSEQYVAGTGAAAGTWQKVVVVIDGVNMKLYVDGTLLDENTNTGITTSALGTDLLAYLGKSFYSGDAYFKGSFDNIRIYNRALSQDEILADVIDKVALLKGVRIGTVPEDPENTTGTDSHTAVTASIDSETGEITSYLRKTADITSVPVVLSLITDDVSVKVNGNDFANGSKLNLENAVTLTVSYGDRTETYTIKRPKMAGNPILPGQYADPDIDCFDGRYWIYPTTDGTSGWGGTVFHAWSSADLVNWVDEGVILDVKEDDPGMNEYGIRIADSPWSDGNAWAPSIEEKNGKYYFYYCGNVNSSYTSICGSGKAIGVAVADDPAGPYVASELPIVYPKMVNDAGIGFSGQVIDPSVFTDDDGTSYLFFGNGGNGSTVVTLNDDMLTADESTLRRVKGMTDFRESVVVTKRNGLYHFTWSCDDTGSPNYHVNYGTAESLEGTGDLNVTYRYTLLQKDESGDMLGTAHQSVLYLPETDKCYIAYHRFYTPLGVYTDGLGYHRETCIDEITFDENGLMKPLVPTMKGMAASEEFPQTGGDSGTTEPTPGGDSGTTEPTPGGDSGTTDTTPGGGGTESPSGGSGAGGTQNPSDSSGTTAQPTAPTAEMALQNNPGLPGGTAEESKNSVFATLSARVSKTTKNSNTIKWLKVKDADGYIVFGNKCNAKGKKYKFEVLSIIEKNSTTSYTQKKLAKGTGYKYLVQAYKMKDGKLEILSTSKSMHAITKGGKYGNTSSLKLNKSKVSLKVGKKLTLKVKETVKGGKKNVHRKVAFESSNPKVASVTAKGVIKAKKKGTCYIYAYAQNGVYKRIKVTVKK